MTRSMVFRFLFFIGIVVGIASATATSTAAQSLCDFDFEVDTQSSAFQAMIVDGEQKRGLWLSINRAPTEVRKVARFVGRLQVCLMTPDGKPREIVRNGRPITLKSPFVTSCTATLLPGNKLLTNHHCYYDPSLTKAGFTRIQEARINFLYREKDDLASVKTYLYRFMSFETHAASA